MIGNNLLLIRKYQRNESDCQKDGNARVNKPLDAFPGCIHFDIPPGLDVVCRLLVISASVLPSIHGQLSDTGHTDYILPRRSERF